MRLWSSSLGRERVEVTLVVDGIEAVVPLYSGRRHQCFGRTLDQPASSSAVGVEAGAHECFPAACRLVLATSLKDLPREGALPSMRSAAAGRVAVQVAGFVAEELRQDLVEDLPVG